MVGSWLKRFLSQFTALANDRNRPPAIADPPKPEQSVAIIGDIHGRDDLLDRLLAKLDTQATDSLLVFVGDYVDRGPDARLVLERLRAMPKPAVFLLGNHEFMMLEFLDNPIETGGRWLRNGGDETLSSFGIELDQEASTAAVLAASDALRQALADGTEAWLRACPLYWRSGNLLVNHAGPDPAAPVAAQEDQSFLWGHGRFQRDARRDGLWVAHGHWVRARPHVGDGRIAVDTGAWKTGKLTAALIDTSGQIRFISTP